MPISNRQLYLSATLMGKQQSHTFTNGAKHIIKKTSHKRVRAYARVEIDQILAEIEQEAKEEFNRMCEESLVGWDDWEEWDREFESRFNMGFVDPIDRSEPNCYDDFFDDDPGFDYDHGFTLRP